MPAPLTTDQRTTILALHAAGHSRNQIAREAGISASSVSRICKAEGLTFDRAQTAAATMAKVVDAKARRAQISLKLLDRADALLNEMDGPRLVFNFGGKDNTYEEHELPSAPSGDKRNLMAAAALALQRHEALVKLDMTDQDHSAVDAWLEHMTGGPLGSQAAARQEPPRPA